MLESIWQFFVGKIASPIGTLFTTISDYTYISEWWLAFFVILGVSLVILKFLPSSWVWPRIVLGFLTWTALVAAVAATKVWLRMRRQTASQSRPAPAPQREPEWPRLQFPWQ